MENASQNYYDFCVFVFHTVVFDDAGFNLLLNEYPQKFQGEVGDDFDVCWTMVGVAHTFNSHDVGASPVSNEFLVLANLIHDLFEFGVISIGYVEVV